MGSDEELRYNHVWYERGNNVSESSTNCFTFISVIFFSRGKWKMIDFIYFIKEGVTIVATYVFV